MVEGTSSLLLPTPFNGRPEEDIREFLKTVKLWSTLLKADEETRRSALVLLLRGNAASWFHTQLHEVTESYREFKKALESYGPQREHVWKATANLWQLQQAKSPSTENFITSVVKAGRRIGIKDEQLLLIAI